MKHLNKLSTEVFMLLVDGLDYENEYRKIDTDPSFMAVNVNFLGVFSTNLGEAKMFSIAHNYVQNGDLMADPDMQFVLIDGQVYPMTYQLDGLGVYNEGILIECGIVKVAPRTQRDLTSFANTWMRNIKMQQDLKPKAEKRVFYDKPEVQRLIDRLKLVEVPECLQEQNEELLNGLDSLKD